MAEGFRRVLKVFSFRRDSDAAKEDTVYGNGTKKAKKVLKRDVNWYDGQRNRVIAIDFGTSTIAVAWQDEIGTVFDLPIHENSKSIPTVLLVKGNNRTEIGERALIDYGDYQADIPGEATPVFFETVKMELQHEKSINRANAVVGSDGKSYYLIEVIALILLQVKQRIQKYFRNRYAAINMEEFSWVLTVPALWGTRGRAMMREAAYLAGICTECEKYEQMLELPLKTVEEHNPPEIKDENSDRLSLVFEPEAAASWCMDLSKADAKDKSDFSASLSTTGCFLTVDVGGGTIDITAHQVDTNGKMIIFDMPCGKVFGGSVINTAFITFLEKIIMEGIEHYYSAQDSLQRKAEIQTLKDKTFEMVKKNFADDETADINVIHLPKSFCERYRHILERSVEKSIDHGADYQFKKKTYQLRISKAKLKEFMDGCLYQIEECINNAISSLGVQPKIIYLVGGFGGSNYVIEHIREVFKGSRVIVPQFHELAVVRGACLYFKTKPIRIADATYGTVCKLPYDERNEVHRQAEKVIGKDGTQYCESLFKPFIHMGEPLDPEYVYKTVYSPIREDQKTLLLSLYSIKENYVDFVEKNKELHPGMTLLGRIFVDLESMKHVQLNQRYVKLLIDFSSVEITICAYFSCDGIEKKLKTSTDFLSTMEKIEEFQCI